MTGVASAGHPLATFRHGLRPSASSRGRSYPDGFDTVAMQEDVRVEAQGDEQQVWIPPGLKKGVNRRLPGEDSQRILTGRTGTRLRPQDVASAAACGFACATLP